MFNHQAPSYTQHGISGVRKAGMIHKSGFGLPEDTALPLPSSKYSPSPDMAKAMEGVVVFSGGTLTLLALVGWAIYNSDKKFL